MAYDQVVMQKSGARVKKRDISRSVRKFSGSIYKGPLPPSEMIIEYNKLYSGSAEKMILMAEREQVHRHLHCSAELDLTRYQMRARERSIERGQWMGLSIALVVFSLCTYLIATGNEVAGTLLASVDLLALVALFVLGKHIRPGS